MALPSPPQPPEGFPAAYLLPNAVAQIATSQLGLAYDAVRDFNASGSSQSTTGSISAGSTTLTLASAIDFQNGQGINIANAGPLPTISAPGAPTVTATGTTGSTSWAYAVAALDGKGGETAASSVTTITNGNATLSSTNYNAISWTAVSGAAGYAVYRTTAGGTPNTTGLIALTAATTFDDTGVAVITPPVGVAASAPASALGDLLVTTIQGGAGTTTLTLAAAASTAVSGAAVYHDDTAAIVSLHNASGPARRRIPAGTYNVSGALNPNGVGNIEIVGDGPGTIIQLLGNAPFAGYLWGIGNQMTLTNLVVDGAVSGQVQVSHGLLAYRAASPLVRNVTVRNFGGMGVYFTGNTGRPAILNCHVHNNGMLGGNAGINIDTNNYSTSADGLLTGCVVYDNGLDGIQVAQGGWRVIANKSSNNGQYNATTVGAAGIYVPSTSNLTIVGNLCLANSGLGIDTGGMSESTVVGNYVASSGKDGIGLANATGVTCVGNVCVNNGQSNTVNRNSGIVIWNSSSYIAVTGNVCYDNQSTPTQQYGISTLEGSQGTLTLDTTGVALQITGNTVAHNGTQGIYVGGDVAVSANKGYNPVGAVSAPAVPASGTALTNPFPVPVRVFITGGTVSGIAINGTTTGVTSGLVELGPRESITLTYSAAPTWTWFGL